MIGERIRMARKQLHWTQDRLAEVASIAREQVSRYETGKIVPDTATIKKIAEALNCSPSDLMDDDYQAGLPDSVFKEGTFVLSIEEKQIVLDYRKLPDEGKAFIRTAMDGALNIYKKKADAYSA